MALKRALGNLVRNAILYGGRADVSVEPEQDGYVIIVRDSGPGIPEAELDRVFTPFFRLETSRNKSSGGVGLGLSIARSTARAHGGDIRLVNRPEGGLEARLFLPAAPGA
jgi:signal transduction histidine kinase